MLKCSGEITGAITLDDEAWRLRIDSYWAEYLGCCVDALHHPRRGIVFSKNSPGIFGLMVGDARVYSVNHQLGCLLPNKDILPTWIAGDEFTLAQPMAALDENGFRTGEAYGPGYLTYCHSRHFRPADDADVCPLREDDRDEIEWLGQQVGWTDLFHETASSWIARFGIFREKHLISIAIVRSWAGQVGSMMVATHPAHRRRGYAIRAVSMATRWVLDETDLIPQYDTATTNVSSLKVAQLLGYQHYGQILYIQVV
ncbi:MAG: GNAT family N-acetyltransferase [Anaerolineales bacterium]|nr:GNAT family N-acetyltransferase [Anaerolineales bacterium]